MGEPFKGTVNIDINDSTPDWEPYALGGAHTRLSVPTVNDSNVMRLRALSAGVASYPRRRRLQRRNSRSGRNRYTAMIR